MGHCCIMREISTWQVMRDRGKDCGLWMEGLHGIEELVARRYHKECDGKIRG